MRIKTTFILLLLTVANLFAVSEVVKMSSPDGKYMLILDNENTLSYQLVFNNQEVIKSSRLGIISEVKWDSNLTISTIENHTVDTVWNPVYGERSRIVDNYNAWNIKIAKTNSKDTLELQFRIYNEGAAFRYSFLGNKYLSITDELTEFSMPKGTMAYFTPKAQTLHTFIPLLNWKEECERPLLMELPSGQYVCLTEARVLDYVRTKFKLKSEHILTTSMYGKVDEIAPYCTPWRVIMCGSKPTEILQNNDLVLNLNEPSRLNNTQWIRPGKIMRETTLTTKGAKELVDFAEKRKIQYIHFDAGWYGYEYTKESDATTVTLDPRRNPNPNALDLQEVIRYAKDKGIGVFLYVNQRALQAQLDEILPLYKSWGISGIKFGFVQVGSQVWTKWVHEAVKKCAQYELMVDIHDEYRPTGINRTYPNLLTQEGVRGNEEFPDANNNTILPFTRFVAGAADYTICYYKQDFDKLSGIENNKPGKRLHTTPSHQLALSMIYYSPLQFLYWYDKPSEYENEPEIKFFDDLYTTWDDTQILDGNVGEFISVARRKGDEWFVGAITNNDQRALKIEMRFLPENKKYLAEIYTDGNPTIKTKTKVRVSTYVVHSASLLNVQLKNSGGIAIRLVPYTEKDTKVKKYKNQIL